MLKLRPKIHSKTLAQILSKPISPIDYCDAPELVRSVCLAENGEPVKDQTVTELGLNPTTQKLPKLCETVPACCIHELADVHYSNGILFSQNNKFFPDNMRVFDKSGGVLRQYTSTLYNLGNLHLVPQFPLIDSEVVEYKDPVVPFFVPPIYGHWLMEVLPAFWILPWLKDFFKDKPVTFLLCEPMDFRLAIPFLQNSCSLLGIDIKSFMPAASNMILKQVFFPTKSYMHYGFTSSLAKKIWSDIRDKYAQKSVLRPVKKIYVTRKNIRNRQLVNEDQCEALFEKHGFLILKPEKLSFAEQVAFFSNATHIAGPIGTGMHNTIFSNHPTKLKTLTLAPRTWDAQRAFVQIERAYDRIAYYALGTYIESQFQGFNSPWQMNIKNLDTAIEQWLA